VNIQDNIANEFNEFSKNYTSDMIGCVPYYLDLVSCFTENLPNDFNPQYILDLGCGNGNISGHILQKFPDAIYTLVDASREMIELCQKKFSNYNVSCIESYFQNFSFKEAKYDLVVAGFSLHHCNSKEKKELFKKIFASLKKSGIFACSDLMISKDNSEHSKLNDRWKSFVHKTFPNGGKWEWLMEHYNEFDKPDDLKDQLRWLQQIGFRNIDVRVYENYWGHFRAKKI